MYLFREREYFFPHKFHASYSLKIRLFMSFFDRELRSKVLQKNVVAVVIVLLVGVKSNSKIFPNGTKMIANNLFQIKRKRFANENCSKLNEIIAVRVSNTALCMIFYGLCMVSIDLIGLLLSFLVVIYPNWIVLGLVNFEVWATKITK